MQLQHKSPWRHLLFFAHSSVQLVLHSPLDFFYTPRCPALFFKSFPVSCFCFFAEWFKFLLNFFFKREGHWFRIVVRNGHRAANVNAWVICDLKLVIITRQQPPSQHVILICFYADENVSRLMSLLHNADRKKWSLFSRLKKSEWSEAGSLPTQDWHKPSQTESYPNKLLPKVLRYVSNPQLL